VSAGEPIFEYLTWSSNEGPALTVLGGRPTVRHSIVSRPGVPSGAATGVVLSESARPILESNLFDGCYDGLVSLPEDAPRALDRLLDDARRDEGLREGDPLFERPERLDCRLNDDSPARVGKEIGAFGGANPLVFVPESSDARTRRGLETEDPEDTILGPTVPNPFAPATTVHFTMVDPAVVDLAVYNILGQRVRTLHAGDLGAGEHSRVWDGRDDRGVDAPGGIYFVRITRGELTESRRIVLMR
jgi:hypothetical protein